MIISIMEPTLLVKLRNWQGRDDILDVNPYLLIFYFFSYKCVVWCKSIKHEELKNNCIKEFFLLREHVDLYANKW